MRSPGTDQRGATLETILGPAAIGQPATSAAESVPGDPFGLVRLRLLLALIAAAMAPVVVVTVILPALSPAARPQDRARIEARSIAVSASLAGEIARVRSGLALVAADHSAAQAFVGGGRAAALSPLLPQLGHEIASLTAVDTRGGERTVAKTGSVGASRAAPASDRALVSRASAAGPNGVTVGEPSSSGASGLILAVPIPAGSSTSGILLARLSMPALLHDAMSDAALVGGYALVVDAASGAVVADSRGSGATPGGDTSVPAIDTLIGGLVQRADRAWTSLADAGWVVGISPLTAGAGTASGSPDWSVVVAEPDASSTSLALLLALGSLLLVLLALASWMTHLVLRPARELQASRAELDRLYRTARTEALLDPMTGVGNQRAFVEEIERQLELSRRHGTPVALVLIDLDDFKSVNDRDGHPAGDRVLVAFASRLRSTVRLTDRPFRLGGDEFAVVMPASDVDGAQAVARRLLARSLQPPSGASDEPAVSFSAGVAAAPDHGTSRTELYARADAALYWAKRHGRTSVDVFDPSRHRVNPTFASELAGGVLSVLQRRALRVLFQPIVSLADGTVLGFEALSRPDPSTGFTDAAGFFGAALTSGRMLEVDAVCIDAVLAAADGLPRDAFLTINLSPLTLESAEFSPMRLMRLLQRAGLSPDRVVIELTEREPIDDLDRVRTNVEGLQAMGVRIAADDIGAGNSGLQLLNQVRFDIVKIDISLVRDAAGRRRSLEVMRSLVAIAHNWGAVVVAEGVETSLQLETVRELGVDAAQGYLLGRPAQHWAMTAVPIEELIAGPPRPVTPFPFAASRSA